MSGYELLGQATLTCTANTSWSSPPPVCQRVVCPDLSAPSHGNITAMDFKFGSAVHFKCLPGFVLVGVSKLVCQADRTWNARSPVCVPIKCPIEKLPANAKLISRNYTFQGSEVYGCETGYEVGGGSRQRRCMANRTWSGVKLYCKGIPSKEKCLILDWERPPSVHHYTCLSLPVICSEQIFDPPNMLTGLIVHWFELTVVQSTLCLNVSFMIFCLLSAVYCGHPGTGPFLLQRGDNFTFNQSVMYSCPRGFTMIGDSLLRCTASAQWSASPPLCIARSCNMPVPPGFSQLVQVNRTFNGSAVFQCLIGYHRVSGELSWRCNESGRWFSKQLLECKCKLTVCMLMVSFVYTAQL